MWPYHSLSDSLCGPLAVRGEGDGHGQAASIAPLIAAGETGEDDAALMLMVGER